MSRPLTKNRIYTGLFILILLIVIPYFIGRLSGIVVALIFVVLFAAVIGLVKQLWRIPLLSNLQTRSPMLSLIIKSLIVTVLFTVLIIIIYTAAIPPQSWLPIAD
jgi:hypothetical protein